jgi:hypothetical protein
MKKIIFSVALLLMAILVYPRVFSFVYRVVPYKLWNERIAYGQVRDIYHPRTEDYQALQKFLYRGHRRSLDSLDDMKTRMRNFKIIGKIPEELPQFGSITVNCAEEDKERCVIVYASFNMSFPLGLKRLVDRVAKSFTGSAAGRTSKRAISPWPMSPMPSRSAFFERRVV